MGKKACESASTMTVAKAKTLNAKLGTKPNPKVGSVGLSKVMTSGSKKRGK